MRRKENKIKIWVNKKIDKLFKKTKKHAKLNVLEELIKGGKKDDIFSERSKELGYDWSCVEDEYTDEQAYNPIGRCHGYNTSFWLRNRKSHGRHEKKMGSC